MSRLPLRLGAALLATAGLLTLAPARAEFAIPGFELVHTVPVETQLATPDLRGPVEVWRQMIDGARREIVIGQFYVAGRPGEPLDAIIERLEAAAARGVRIRFLMELRGERISEAATIARLRAIPGLEFRVLEFGKLSASGIIHAKYFVVDGREAFVGSQNFDWRALKHIHETGLRITDATVAGQVQAIFDLDWQAQGQLAAGQPATQPPPVTAPVDLTRPAFLLASPRAWNPPGVGDSQEALPRLLAQAQREIRVQLLDYAPLSYASGRRPFYAVVDNAVRAAAARGVKVKLLVSHWNTEEPAIHHLKSLAMLPEVEVRIATLPRASEGFIPFARVIHTKAMTIDGELAWIGTSNWMGGYFDNSRNLEVVLRDKAMATRVAALHEQLWASPYSERIDVNKHYPKPEKGEPATGR